MRPSTAVSSLLFVVALLAGAFVGIIMGAESRDPILFGVPTFVGFVIGLFLRASVKVVAQWERMVVLRLGKFQAIADPGLRLLIPVIDTPHLVEMRVQTVDVAQQQAITQDNVPVVVNGVIFFKVIDPEAAALKVAELPRGDLAPRASDAPRRRRQALARRAALAPRAARSRDRAERREGEQVSGVCTSRRSSSRTSTCPRS